MTFGRRTRTDGESSTESLDAVLGDADRFVIIDAETTGVYRTDRIVEVAAITLNRWGRIIDEWDTLVDPQRDVGPTHIHGITATMVTAAPTFDEIAGALAERVHGAVIVAHNLDFDVRMVQGEFDRLGGGLEPGEGVCTLRCAGERLPDACRRHGISLSAWHRALADARATAALFRKVSAHHPRPTRPAFFASTNTPFRPRTLRREAAREEEIPMPYLARLADRLHHHGQRGSALSYLDQLDFALADLQITDEEHSQLDALAADLAITPDEAVGLHQQYFDELAAAASRDGRVSAEEHDLLMRVASTLGLPTDVITKKIDRWQPESESIFVITPGITVCFTGAATHPDGSELSRGTLFDIARDLDLLPTDKLTKSGTALLVAADPASQSGKAAKARSWGIPIASVSDFVHGQPGGSLPVI